MDYFTQLRTNFEAVTKRDEQAKAKGTLLGRYIQESFADGYAYYRITKVNKKTVRIEVITDIGDDWVIPYWGASATIDIEYAKRIINRRDGHKKLFGNR